MSDNSKQKDAMFCLRKNQHHCHCRKCYQNHQRCQTILILSCQNLLNKLQYLHLVCFISILVDKIRQITQLNFISQIISIMQFQFPQSLTQFRQIENIDQLKLLFVESAKQNHLRYTHQIRKGKYVYSKCKWKHCNSFLRYKYSQEENVFNLSSHNTAHKHSLSTNKKNENLKQFILGLPMGVQLSTACKLAVQNLNEKPSRFYYYFNKLGIQNYNLRDQLKRLDEEGCEIQYQPFQPDSKILPNIMIVITPSMKTMFRKYSQIISIDFTYKLIKEVHSTGKRWKMGYFVGNSLSRRIIPFALVFALQESADTYYRLIKAFGDIMGFMPKVIATDQSSAAKSAIKSLIEDREYQGIHILDLYHILTNVKKKLKVKKDIFLYSELAACTNKKSFEVKLSEAYEKSNIEDLPILQKFIHESSSYCFSQVDPYFIGFCSSTGSNEKIHDLIKSILPIQKPFHFVLQKALSLAEKLILSCELTCIERQPIENYFCYPQIKQIRSLIDKKICLKFCQQLSEIACLQFTQESEERFIIKDMKINEFFHIKQNRNNLVCECQYQQKTGLICSHLLKICLIKNIRIKNFISQRWIRLNRIQIKGKGRGHSTRRKRN